MALLERMATMAVGTQSEDVGTGSGFGRAVLICAGVSSLMACLLTVLYASLQPQPMAIPASAKLTYI